MDVDSLIGKHKIPNLEGLAELAAGFAQHVLPGDILLLTGQLGAGKTTFTQFLAKELGVRDVVTSPTYTLVGEYPVMDNPRISAFFHIDLYRAGEQPVSRPPALTDEYLQEIIGGAQLANAVIVIEWGEMLNVSLKNRVWHVLIEPSDHADERFVTIYT